MLPPSPPDSIHRLNVPLGDGTAALKGASKLRFFSLFSGAILNEMKGDNGDPQSLAAATFKTVHHLASFTIHVYATDRWQTHFLGGMMLWTKILS